MNEVKRYWFAILFVSLVSSMISTLHETNVFPIVVEIFLGILIFGGVSLLLGSVCLLIRWLASKKINNYIFLLRSTFVFCSVILIIQIIAIFI